MELPKKRIHWAQIQDFLKLMDDKQRTMSYFQEKLNRKFITIDMAETIYVNPMMEIYNSLRIILKENNILTEETLKE